MSSFKHEHNSSIMNNTQDLPWDNPRFRNWVAVARACHAVERAVAVALQPFALKPAQLDVLMNLYRHPGMSQHDLARKLLVGRSNITMILPQLEQRKLVRREGDDKDKRVLRLTLTTEGEALLMKALKVHTALIEKAMSQSTPDECDMLGDQMRRVAEILKTD
jgi:DNA-binding MarR family transcriptional regulator